ncbi:MAG: hypothetical protein JXA07_15080 [Spirochaetes bacterium]|nr:hypothetical protein [Spirochaetota bacterium]
MKRTKVVDQATRIEQEIVRKERLARDAKSKGMNTTYSVYLNDIANLKAQLQKVSTGPGPARKVV